MTLSRRTVLTGIAASAFSGTLPVPAAFASRTGVKHITAKPGHAMLLEPGEPETPIWGYDGLVPGPEIRTLQGAQFNADLLNALPQPTTIHWHGIRIDNAMDGVAGLTQDAVAPGGAFPYRFTPPDAGTFWYHPHNRTWEQLARGLYGAFIVEEENPPRVDRDHVLIFDDWRIGEDGKIHEASLGSFHDRSHAGRLGNILTLNGAHTHDVPVMAGERLRLRLLNASTARVLAIAFPGHSATVIALDGQPVTPFPLPTDGIRLAPAQRTDVILDATGDVGGKTPIEVNTGREKLVAGHVVYDAAKRIRRASLTDSIALAPNPMPTTLRNEPDTLVELDMTGGARSWFESATYRGKTYDVRTLAREHGKMWAFNGIAGKPDKPLARFDLGQTVHIKIIDRKSVV